jgi:hypothetical protein
MVKKSDLTPNLDIERLQTSLELSSPKSLFKDYCLAEYQNLAISKDQLYHDL